MWDGCLFETYPAGPPTGGSYGGNGRWPSRRVIQTRPDTYLSKLVSPRCALTAVARLAPTSTKIWTSPDSSFLSVHLVLKDWFLAHLHFLSVHSQRLWQLKPHIAMFSKFAIVVFALALASSVIAGATSLSHLSVYALQLTRHWQLLSLSARPARVS